MPNLRVQATTPVYGTFPPEVGRTLGSHSRYSTSTSESRYNPAARYEYQPVQEESLDYEGSMSGLAPPLGVSTPEPIHRGYSPYAPPPAPVYAPPVEAHHYEPPEPEPLKEEDAVQEEEEQEKPKSKEKNEGEKKGMSIKHMHLMSSSG